MSVYFTKMPKEYTRDKRHEFDHKRLNRVFVLWLYRSKKLDEYAKEMNLARAARGLIPKGYDVHHILPLSGGGNNRLSNLCLIEKSLHKFINRYCFDPALKKVKEGETIQINVPDFKHIALRREYQSWMDKELQKHRK